MVIQHLSPKVFAGEKMHWEEESLSNAEQTSKGCTLCAPQGYFVLGSIGWMPPLPGEMRLVCTHLWDVSSGDAGKTNSST